MILALAHAWIASTTIPTPNDLLSILLTWGPGGIVLGLVLTGQLEPKRFREMISSDRDAWKEAFEKEQEAHQITRMALAKAEERADVAVEAAKTTTHLLEELDHRKNQSRDN